MFTHDGISVDSAVVVEGRCPLSCEAVGDQAQLTFGRNRGSLHLVLEEEALRSLLALGTNALKKIEDVDVVRPS